MTDEKIKHLEQLSRLSLSEGEREKIKNEINEIIEYFNTLREVDTEGVEARSHSLDVVNVFRSDEVKPSLSVDDVTANAKTKDGYFVVPVSVEGEDA